MEAKGANRRWWSHVTKYHWYVFALAALGWLFDTMDGQIFIASRSITMRDLLPGHPDLIRTQYGSYCTSLFIVGWATGGLIFGTLGDRWGRARTMALTILIYALFTGLSGFARTWLEFGFFRFLTGLGVGGEFAAGTALVAEVMPEAARARALGLLQSLSAVGNVIGAALFGLVEPVWGWQGLYFVGAFPALLAVIVRMGLKEPDRWIAARNAAVSGRKLGRLRDLFIDPRWRRNTLVGLGLAIAGVVGVWGLGFYSPELIDKTIPAMPAATRGRIADLIGSATPRARRSSLAALSETELRKYTDLLQASRLPGEGIEASVELAPERRMRLSALLERSVEPADMTRLKYKALILQQIGAFFGMFVFGLIAVRIGRRPSFLISFLVAWAAIAVVFLSFQSSSQIWYLWPLLGFGTLMPFAGYAVYFPELFPTRLRTTGTGFCYNVGRYIAALGPPALASLARALDGRFAVPGFRVAAVIVASCYLLGIVTLIWAPETNGRPLPED